MKKLIGLTLLTAALFADSDVEMTPPTETPKDQAPIIESDESSFDTSLDQDPVESYVNESSSETPEDQESVDKSFVNDPTPIDPAPIEQYCIPNCDEYGSYVLAEFKMGYFRFGDKQLRHQYDEGLLDLQLSSSYRIWKPLYAYFSVEYIGADGRVAGSHQKIKIRMVPLSLGVRYMLPITCDLKYYLTLGPRYFLVHQWTHKTSQTPNGWGGFFNTGFIYYLDHNVVVDFFGEYSYKKLRLRPLHGTHQAGGLTLGAGIGYFW